MGYPFIRLAKGHPLIGEVLQQALTRFGRGNFAFQRIGYRSLGKWRKAQ
jgi:hypothetical protein